eukprot:7386976-Prymnesium_polylepis.1
MVSHHFCFTNGCDVVDISSSDTLSRFQCSRTSFLKGSHFSSSACSPSPTQPGYASRTNTNFARKYRMCSSYESPMPFSPAELS